MKDQNPKTVERKKQEGLFSSSLLQCNKSNHTLLLLSIFVIFHLFYSLFLFQRHSFLYLILPTFQCPASHPSLLAFLTRSLSHAPPQLSSRGEDRAMRCNYSNWLWLLHLHDKYTTVLGTNGLLSAPCTTTLVSLGPCSCGFEEGTVRSDEGRQRGSGTGWFGGTLWAERSGGPRHRGVSGIGGKLAGWLGGNILVL